MKVVPSRTPKTKGENWTVELTQGCPALPSGLSGLETGMQLVCEDVQDCNDATRRRNENEMKFSQVTNTLWRGPRPEPTDTAWLKYQNIHTILSLEGVDEDDKEVREFPDQQVVSRPIGAWQIYVGGISQNYLHAILNVMQSQQQQFGPLLLHCEHGEDRTGLIVAAWRVRMQGWTKEDAWVEAKNFGYRWYLNYGLNRVWEKFNGGTK